MNMDDPAERKSSHGVGAVVPVQGLPTRHPDPAVVEEEEDTVLDPVDEASEKSFPASDVPTCAQLCNPSHG